MRAHENLLVPPERASSRSRQNSIGRRQERTDNPSKNLHVAPKSACSHNWGKTSRNLGLDWNLDFVRGVVVAVLPFVIAQALTIYAFVIDILVALVQKTAFAGFYVTCLHEIVGPREEGGEAIPPRQSIGQIIVRRS